MELKLAAILATEVAGFGRLMRAHQATALATLQKRHHALIDRAVAMHRGRFVALRVDRTLVAFEVVVDAMECALAIQRGMALRNRDLPPQHRILLRAGLDHRDVIADKGDLSGPGIQVACFLRDLGLPGDLIISDNAFLAVRKRVKVGFEGRGMHRIEGIENLVRAIGVADVQGAEPKGWWPWRRRA